MLWVVLLVNLQETSGSTYQARRETAISGSYTLSVEILQPSRPPVPIHTNGYHVDPKSTLSIYVTAADIRRRLPEFAAGARYQVRVTLTIAVPTSTASAEWSDAFVEAVFPARERSLTIVKDVAFGA